MGCEDRKSTRLNSSHLGISYAVFCLKKKTALRRQVSEVRHGAVPEAPRLHRVRARGWARRGEARAAREALHLHQRLPLREPRRAHHARGRRPRRRRASLLPADGHRARAGRDRHAARADLPADPRGRRLQQLLLEGEAGMSNPTIRDRVAVVGVGCSKFGEHYDRSAEDLVVEAAFEAYADAGIEPGRIEAAWVGTLESGFAGTALADPLKLYDRPITRVENYCASGMDAFRNACLAVAAGMYDCVLAVGFEKLRDSGRRGLGTFGNHPVVGHGTTAPSLFAMAANRYFKTYGVTRDALAKVAIKNHHNGTMSPKAHFQMEVTEAQVLGAPLICSPLGLFDCCPTTDGAAAAIVCRREIARTLRPDAILVKGIGLAVTSGEPYLKPGFAYTGFPATQRAARSAYEQAGITPDDLDLAEVHDCFTITEILNYEDLGLCAAGEGWRYVSDGRAAIGGEVAVNPSGGLKSFGHPIGATGVRMIYEVCQQLWHRAGKRQVPDAQLGLAHNLGGPGAVGCLTVLANS